MTYDFGPSPAWKPSGGGVTKRKQGAQPRGGRHHGYISTYVHGCRCDDCRAVATVYRRKYARPR